MTSCSKPELSQHTLSDKVVECYLMENPDYFERYPDLLISLSIPHHSGVAVSLIERQVEVLRQKNRRLERKLMEIVQVARDNEGLSTFLHRLALELIDAHSVDGVIDLTKNLLRSEFSCTEVVIHLISEAGSDAERLGVPTLVGDQQRVHVFDDLFKTRRPICGRLSKAHKHALFGNRGLNIASAAMIPLMAGRKLGVIALGTEEKGRFRNRMGTLFLDYLGELVSRAIRSHQQDAGW